jgi:hypothetical protein
VPATVFNHADTMGVPAFAAIGEGDTIPEEIIE